MVSVAPFLTHGVDTFCYPTVQWQTDGRTELPWLV